MFSDLDDLEFDDNLPEVGKLLRRAKRAFNDDRKSRKTDAPRQQLITELFA